jgi:hydrogenase-4 component F
MILTYLLLIPLVAALVSLVSTRANLRFIAGVAVVATGSECVLALRAVLHRSELHAPLLYLDAFGSILLLIITFVGVNTALYSVGYLATELRKGIIGPSRVWQYWILFHVFMFAMMLSVTAQSPIVMWAAIEATTLATVFLVSFYNKSSSLEAGWKYLVVNSIGLLIGFFGTLTMLSLVGPTHEGVLSWHTLMELGSTFDPLAVKIAFIFILIGYGTKVGLVPMHTWLPDAHGKAPAPISALLSGVLLNTAFLAIARYKVVVDASVGQWWASNILLVFGVLSVVSMGFMLLVQRRYKRMLAYSSIENMGIIAVGFGFGGVGVLYALFHMMYHALVKSALFLAAGNLFLAYSSGKIRNVRGVLTLLPWTGPCVFLGILALTGMPPFGTFMSKFGVLGAGVGSHPFVVGFLLLGFALVFIGLVLHGTMLLFGHPPVSTETAPIEQGEQSISTVLPIVVLLGAAIVFAFYLPASLHTLIEEAAATYAIHQ